MSDRFDQLAAASDTITAGDNQLKSIAAMIAEEADLQHQIDTADAMLKDAKRKRYDLLRNKLPEAMGEAGMAEFVAEGGIKAELKWDTDGALGSPKTKEEFEERDRKLDLIEQHGGDEIIKMNVVLAFPKGQFGAATDLETELRKTLYTTGLAEKGVTVYRERTVNHQSLMAWIRERMSADEVTERLPLTMLERLGIWYGRVAKIKRPKEPK